MSISMRAGFKEPTKPGCLGANHGETLDLSFLSGKTIVGAGCLDFSGEAPGSLTLSEGSFAIDYQDGEDVKRVVFDFNDLGFWITNNGLKGGDVREDSLRERLNTNWSDVGTATRIRDDALGRRYVFEDDDGKELFSLSVTDLKLMGKRVSRHFQQAEKDFGQVMISIEEWVFYGAVLEDV